VARTYTADEKTAARALAVEAGLAEAHRRTEIPKPTISRWLTTQERAEMAQRSDTKTRAATEEHKRQMALRRIDAQAEFAQSAVFAARKVRGAEDGKDAHGWAMASGTMLDKLRLEMGESTDRIDVLGDSRDRAADLVDELESRRARKAS